MSALIFARTFLVEPYGQILAVAKETDDGRPEVQWSIVPPGLGLCSMGMGFEDNDEGWDRRDAYFAALVEESAAKAAHAITESIKELTS